MHVFWIGFLFSIPISASVLNRSWCEWETEHFSLYSDMRIKDAEQISNDLLEFHYASNVLLSSNAIRSTKINIIIFRNAREFRRELKQNKFAGLMQPSFQQHQLILTANLRDRDYTEIPFHEYAHHLIKVRIERPIARWFEEGLAQYLATVTIKEHSVEVGNVQRRRILNSLATTQERTWSETLSLDLSHDQTPELVVKYDVALGLVHYLVHGTFETELEPMQRIVQLFQAVNEGANAFDKFLELVGLQQSDLSDALQRHFSKTQELLTFEIPVPQQQVKFRDCLDDVDRHLLIARSVLSFNRDRANEVLQQIELQYPGDYRVHALLSEVHRHDAEVALKYAETAYRTRPDSPVTNLALANAYVRLCAKDPSQPCIDHLKQAESHYRKVLTFDHSRVDAAFGLGSVYLHRGRTGEALNYLRVAQKHTPWSPRVNLQLGEAYRQLGEFRKAERYLTITAEWDENADRRKVALKLLDQVQKELND